MKYIKNNYIILKTPKKDLSDLFPRKHLKSTIWHVLKKSGTMFQKILIINYIINYINLYHFSLTGKSEIDFPIKMKCIKNNYIILKTPKKDLSDLFPRKHLKSSIWHVLKKSGNIWNKLYSEFSIIIIRFIWKHL